MHNAQRDYDITKKREKRREKKEERPNFEHDRGTVPKYHRFIEVDLIEIHRYEAQYPRYNW